MKYKKKYDKLAAKYDDVASDDDPVDYKRHVKRQQALPSTDPFEFLPPELGDEILTYFTEKEHLDAMRVPTTWKSFIESRGSRMSKAMDKIVVKFDSNEVGNLKVRTLDTSMVGGTSIRLQAHRGGFWSLISSSSLCISIR